MVSLLNGDHGNGIQNCCCRHRKDRQSTEEREREREREREGEGGGRKGREKGNETNKKKRKTDKIYNYAVVG